MFLKRIVTFLKALNSNAAKGKVAAGMACDLLLALVPGKRLEIFRDEDAFKHSSSFPGVLDILSMA